MTQKTIVFNTDQGVAGSVVDALLLTSCDVTLFHEEGPFLEALKSEPPSIIVLPVEMLGWSSLVPILDSGGSMDNVAILGVVADPYNKLLGEALETYLADYLLESHPFDVKRFAIAVRGEDAWSGQPLLRGLILLADEDLARRRRMGRMMRLAGFDVDFAESSVDLEKRLEKGDDYSIVVASMALVSDKTYQTYTSDQSTSAWPWLLYSEEQLRRKLSRQHDEQVMTEQQVTPDLILFNINEIIDRPKMELRASRRIQYLTPVQFWMDANSESVWAYSRDLSLNGMFVRTLVPPPRGANIKLSFRSPMADGTVSVTACVAWRREYGPESNPVQPAGMGLQFVNPSRPDAAAIEAGYEDLRAVFARTTRT